MIITLNLSFFLPKYPFFENWSTKDLSMLFLEEKGFKTFVTFVGLLKSSFFIMAVSMPIKYLHLAKLKQELLQDAWFHVRLNADHCYLTYYINVRVVDKTPEKSTWEMKSKLKVDQFYYNCYFTTKSEHFNNLYCSYHTSDLLVDWCRVIIFEIIIFYR